MSSNPNPTKNIWQERAEKLKQIKPEIIKSEPIKSEPIKSEPIKKEFIKSEPIKSEPIKKEFIKKEFIKKEFTPEELIIKKEKTEAFIKSQNHAIQLCLNICNKRTQDDINDSIDYEINFKRILILNIPDDEFICEINTNKYTYSLKRFLSNYHFQNKLREEYIKILPKTWIKLFPGRDENTYCISIQKYR